MYIQNATSLVAPNHTSFPCPRTWYDFQPIMSSYVAGGATVGLILGLVGQCCCLRSTYLCQRSVCTQSILKISTISFLAGAFIGFLASMAYVDTKLTQCIQNAYM